MKFILAGILCATLALPLSLSASLGGDSASIEADRAKLQASLQTTSKDSYEVHQLQSATGVAVREYLSSAGNVFAVSWKGPVPPSLPQILGSYYSQYVDAVKQQQSKRRGHGPIVVQLPGLVVQVGGRARAFFGRAYVPQAVPAGVHLQDIQ
jgi:hypothetical protein